MKKSISVLGSLILAIAVAGPVTAGASTARPSVTDPAGDANGLNDQGFNSLLGFHGDHASGSSFDHADIQKVWFDNDHRELSINVLTSAPPDDADPALSVRVEANEGCLRFEVIVPGETYDGPALARSFSPASASCGEGTDPVSGSFRIKQNRDGTGLTTMSFRLGSHPDLRPHSWLFGPSANVRLVVGDGGDGVLLSEGQFDNTKPGISYRIQEVPPPSVQAPAPASKNGKAHAKKGKKKGHAKHGCDHPGQGHGHDDDCPEEDEQRSASGRPFLL